MKDDLPASIAFFSAEDACTLALKAYFHTCRFFVDNPDRDCSLEDWCTADEFAEAFSAHVCARVGLLSVVRLRRFAGDCSHWNPYVIAREIDPKIIALLGVDSSGEKMNGLPPSENRADNRPVTGAENAE